MTPNVLIVGVGGGSFQIRGIQLGAAMGARVTSSPSSDDWRWADVCVLVKRAWVKFAHVAHTFKVPIVWDALDFWRQPDDNAMPVSDAIALGQTCLNHIRPRLVIGATRAMADDLGGVCLPHHAYRRLSPVPVRSSLGIVAYEGTAKYLGSWRNALETVCAGLGLSFVVNPPDLAVADLIVALRGERWDGEICRRWKSGVKYANAMAIGRPVLTQPSAAFDEIGCHGVVVHTADQIDAAIQSYLPQSARAQAFEQCQSLSAAYALPAVAGRYRSLINMALRQAA